MIEPAFLLADVDWFRIIFLLIIFLGPLLGKLGQMRKPQPKREPPRKRPLPPVPPNRPAANVGGPRQALEDEIEQFLQRARGGKAEPRPQPPPPAVRKPVVAAKPIPLGGRLGRKKTAPTRATPQRPPQAPRPKLGAGVAQHVKEHIQSHPVSEHSRDLGQKVAGADDKVEQHLLEVFDHKLGRLEKASLDQKVTVIPSSAAEFSQMLSDPTRIQQAIILSEILKPPLGLDE